MRRLSRALRDLGVTLVVAVSLVVVPPPARVVANTGCTVQEWGTWSGQAAQMNVGWGSDVGTWSVWITPAGTLAGLLNSPSRSSPGTRIGGGTGSSGSFTWNTYAFPNGLYDIAFTYVRGTGSGGSYGYCALRIANVPTAPSPVRVAPPQSTEDVFDASWAATSAPGGLAFYEYAIDCDVGRIVQTPSQGARLIGQAQRRGSAHILCVRGVDRAGSRGPWAWSDWFLYLALPVNITLVGADPATVGAPYSMSAVFTDSGGRPLAGRQVFFNSSWGPVVGGGITDAAGRASVTVAGPTRSGSHVILAFFNGDGTYQGRSVSRRISAVPDATAPTIPASLTVSPPSSATNAFRASWSASTDTGTGVGRYDVRVNGTLYRTVTSVGSGVHTAEVRAPAVGRHRVEVQAVDRAGNASGWSQPATFELLRQPATIAIDSLPGSGDRCSSVDLRVRLTRDGAPFAGQAVSFAIGSLRATARTAADGTAQVAIRLDIAPGSHTATATYANEAPLPASQASRSIQVTGSPSGSCTPAGGGGQPGGGGGSGGGGQPGGGSAQSGRGGGLSVGIPAR